MEWQDTISAFHSRWTVTGNLGISEAMMDFAAARAHMVDSQMRTAGVTDHRVLAVFGTIPHGKTLYRPNSAVLLISTMIF